jgi:peptidoglycan-N-acetylmuramic acid deacetylase
MSERSRNTSLLLIALTLVAGIAVGWSLRDLGGTATPATSDAVAPTMTITATMPPAPTMPIAQTATPIPVPTLPPDFNPLTPAPTNLSDESVTMLPTWTSTPEPPTATLPPPPTEQPTAAQEMATRYHGHRVAEGETLETIAAQHGSRPELIANYNQLTGEPLPGRMLIIPELAPQGDAFENPPLLVERGPGVKPWVALTLDAGGSGEPTPAILEALRERHIQITFFLTGKWIREHPELVRQIVADGHEIANHTDTHPDLRELSDDEIRHELSETDRAMQEAAGVGTRPFFRPPYGAYDKRVLTTVQAQGYLPVYWTLDSLDSVGEPKTPEFLLERVTAKLTPEQLHGAIILAHCGSQPTADALPKILDRFAEMGLEVRKLSDVLNQ